jgi:type IV secretory pathway VirD2 relaxase
MIRELLGFSICRFNPVLDIRQALERQLEAEGWTELDRQLVRDAGTAWRHRPFRRFA